MSSFYKSVEILRRLKYTSSLGQYSFINNSVIGNIILSYTNTPLHVPILRKRHKQLDGYLNYVCTNGKILRTIELKDNMYHLYVQVNKDVIEIFKISIEIDSLLSSIEDSKSSYSIIDNSIVKNEDDDKYYYVLTIDDDEYWYDMEYKSKPIEDEIIYDLKKCENYNQYKYDVLNLNTYMSSILSTQSDTIVLPDETIELTNKDIINLLKMDDKVYTFNRNKGITFMMNEYGRMKISMFDDIFIKQQDLPGTTIFVYKMSTARFYTIIRIGNKLKYKFLMNE